MNIILISSKLQFKNPITGQPTRPTEEHYYARRVVALIDGEEKHFRFTKDKLSYLSTEDNIISVIEESIKNS